VQGPGVVNLVIVVETLEQLDLRLETLLRVYSVDTSTFGYESLHLPWAHAPDLVLGPVWRFIAISNTLSPASGACLNIVVVLADVQSLMVDRLALEHCLVWCVFSGRVF